MSERAQEVRDADATVVLPTPGRRRMGFAPPLERQAAAADLAALGGLNRLVEAANPILAAVPQIRHALRHPDPASLRARLRAQLSAFEQAARAAGVVAASVTAASRMLCALVDDAASATPWGRDWAQRGLLAEAHGATDGSDEFFSQVDKALVAPAAHAETLELLYVCLALGFEGRYRGGEGARQALAQIRSRLYEALAKAHASESLELSARWQGASVPVRRVPGAMALWGVASLCAVLLAGLYFSYAVSLGSLSDPAASELARLGPLPAFARTARPSVATTARSRELAQAIGMREVEVGEVAGAIMIVLKADELFASGSARLDAALEPTVLRVAQALDRVPGTVVVTGHTDDVPIRTAHFPSNWELSTERARSVVKLMASRMHDAARLRADGVADSQPLVPNDSAAHRARNRRVTILVRGSS